MRNVASISRRAFIGSSVLTGLSSLSQPAVAAELRRNQKRAILVWMSGGPSQFETWDPKPGESTAGPHGVISTSVPGLQFNEHLPRLGRLASQMVVVRSMATSSKEHSQATVAGMTGFLPGRSPTPPSWLSVLSHELDENEALWPSFVSLGPSPTTGYAQPGGGFLGPRCDPLPCPGNGKPPAGLPSTDSELEAVRRRGSLRELLGKDFEYGHEESKLAGHANAFAQLKGLVNRRDLFELSKLPVKRVAAYGNSSLGRDCLLACQLVDRGVPFVLVSSDKLEWDMHTGTKNKQRELNQTFDAAVGAMIDDLIARGLWEHTLVVLMGEFGRTPSYSGGRDHWSTCWSMSFGGAGAKGGAVVGATNDTGREIKDRPVSVPDLLVTFYELLGIDPRKEVDVQGRPTSFLERGIGKPLREVL